MPKRIAHYTLVRPIGKGGMGAVYEAEEDLSGRRVALKVLRDDLDAEEDARRYFINEMRVLASLEHHNIVRSLACFEAEGSLVLVLEYLDGKTLRQVLREQGALHWKEAVRLAREICLALTAAHEHQPPIIHRDLKPENVMRLTNGSVKVMDFGIAKLLESVGATQSFLGTVQYMSPEQIDGLELTPLADLYVLGLLLYELLTGEPPFSSKSQRELFVMQCTKPPPEMAIHLPDALRGLVHQLLRKNPSERPGDALEVAERLAAVLDDGVVSPHSSAGTTQPNQPSPDAPATNDTLALIDAATKPRRRRWLIVLSLAATASVMGAGWLFASGRPLASSWRPSRSATTTAPVVSARTASSAAAPSPPTTILAPSRSAARPSPASPRAPANEPAPGKPASLSFQIKAGTSSQDAAWTAPFRVRFDKRSMGLDYLQAYEACSKRSLALCTQAQWSRACSSRPSLGRIETWLGRVDASGFIVAGGPDRCEGRRAVAGSERLDSRAGVCCERAVAIRSRNTNTDFRYTTAHKLLRFEQALNAADADAAGLHIDPEINRGRTRSAFVRTYRKLFRSHPTQFTHTEACDVVLDVGVVTTWTASCFTVSREDDQISSAIVRYVRGGDDGLIQRRDVVRVLRSFAPISKQVFIRSDTPAR